MRVSHAPELQTLEEPQNSPSSRLIAESAQRPGDDPIFALNAEANRRAQEGEDILNSTLGALLTDEGKLAVMPSVFEALRRIEPEAASSYAPISGPPKFLAAIIDDLCRGTALADHAIAAATPGGTGACHHAIVNFLEPGQSLLTPSYYWGPYGVLAKHTRRGVETFEMFDADGGLNVAALKTAMERQAKSQGRVLLILNTPCNNPTGFSMNDADWEGLVPVLAEIGARVPVALLLDLAYTKFAAPGSVRWPHHVEKLLGKVSLLFAWTASKGFAQYGARIGALVAVEPDPEERKRIQAALGYSCRGTWSNCNHLGMLAITELLTDPELRARCDAERDELRQLLDDRVQVFNELAAKAGLRYPRYEGGFFVAVFTPDGQRTADVMAEQGVFVVPLNGAVRIALCATRAADLPRLVKALEVGVEAAQAAQAGTTRKLVPE